MPLGVGFERAARAEDRHMLADAMDNIGETAPLRRMIETVIDREQRNARNPGRRGQLVENPAVVVAKASPPREPDRSGKDGPEIVERLGDERREGIVRQDRK